MSAERNECDWAAQHSNRAPQEPGRPSRPELVDPRQLRRRSAATRAGHAALIHAIAHIEFNAINLALDAICRFGELPEAYYRDWLRVAAEEATHFRLLREHLHGFAHDYGDFPAHRGLWEMAIKTAHDPLARMALVPRVLEARGLDASPGIMRRLRAGGVERAVIRVKLTYRESTDRVRRVSIREGRGGKTACGARRHGHARYEMATPSRRHRRCAWGG